MYRPAGDQGNPPAKRQHTGNEGFWQGNTQQQPGAQQGLGGMMGMGAARGAPGAGPPVQQAQQQQRTMAQQLPLQQFQQQQQLLQLRQQQLLQQQLPQGQGTQLGTTPQGPLPQRLPAFPTTTPSNLRLPPSVAPSTGALSLGPPSQAPPQYPRSDAGSMMSLPPPPPSNAPSHGRGPPTRPPNSHMSESDWPSLTAPTTELPEERPPTPPPPPPSLPPIDEDSDDDFQPPALPALPALPPNRPPKAFPGRITPGSKVADIMKKFPQPPSTAPPAQRPSQLLPPPAYTPGPVGNAMRMGVPGMGPAIRGSSTARSSTSTALKPLGPPPLPPPPEYSLHLTNAPTVPPSAPTTMAPMAPTMSLVGEGTRSVVQPEGENDLPEDDRFEFDVQEEGKGHNDKKGAGGTHPDLDLGGLDGLPNDDNDDALSLGFDAQRQYDKGRMKIKPQPGPGLKEKDMKERDQAQGVTMLGKKRPPTLPPAPRSIQSDRLGVPVTEQQRVSLDKFVRNIVREFTLPYLHRWHWIGSETELKQVQHALTDRILAVERPRNAGKDRIKDRMKAFCKEWLKNYRKGQKCALRKGEAWPPPEKDKLLQVAADNWLTKNKDRLQPKSQKRVRAVPLV